MAQFAAQSTRTESGAGAVANSSPLGLIAFALTTFVLSCSNAGFIVANGAATHVTIGLAFFYGGLIQLLAGLWAFRAGNTFGGTAFSYYGRFWLSFGFLFTSITGAFTADALGLYLLAWAIFTFFLFLATFRMDYAHIALFGLLTLTFLALALGNLGLGTTFGMIGGWLGIITALTAWYIALSGLLKATNSTFGLPLGSIG